MMMDYKMTDDSLSKIFLADLESHISDCRNFIVKSDRLELIIPAKSQETGELHIWVDGDEITVGIGQHFHTHFDTFSNFATLAEREKEASRQASQFIQDVLADKVIIYVSERSAGCYSVGSKGEALVKPGDKKMVWSGMIE
jgi:hypothetical protein